MLKSLFILAVFTAVLTAALMIATSPELQDFGAQVIKMVSELAMESM